MAAQGDTAQVAFRKNADQIAGSEARESTAEGIGILACADDGNTAQMPQDRMSDRVHVEMFIGDQEADRSIAGSQ